MRLSTISAPEEVLRTGWPLATSRKEFLCLSRSVDPLLANTLHGSEKHNGTRRLCSARSRGRGESCLGVAPMAAVAFDRYRRKNSAPLAGDSRSRRKRRRYADPSTAAVLTDLGAGEWYPLRPYALYKPQPRSSLRAENPHAKGAAPRAQEGRTSLRCGRTKGLGIEELAASVSVHDLLQNPNVCAFYVGGTVTARGFYVQL
jgi:hypothetical protein